MDISVDRATGYAISRKSGSLALWSVSGKKSRNSDRKPRYGKASFGVNQSGELANTNYSFPPEEIGSSLAGLGRKRRRNEVPSSSFGLSAKKLHNGIVGHNLESSNRKLQQLDNDHDISPVNLGCECYNVSSNSENSDRSDGDVILPKRPRVSPRCKRTAGSICLNIETSTSNHEGSGKKDINESSTKNLPLCHVLNYKHEEINEHNQTDRHITVPGTSREDKIYILAGDVNPGSKSNDAISCLDDDGPLVHDSEDFVTEIQEDDEKNLEENAARMLSSRFDPSCTGFCKSGDAYIKNGEKVSHLQLDHSASKGSRAGSLSGNPMIRNLRPRSQNYKNIARKRRHFYEVSYRYVDPYYLVKQRIRVFWPLDKSWYFGLVKQYDPVSKLHHIKYDDRDEEWINLQNERFKLLLFPGEASVNFGINKRKREGETENSCTRSTLNSEPIVSLLSCATHHEAGSSTITRKSNKVIMPECIKPSFLLESQEDTSPDPSDGSKLLLKDDLPLNEDITKFPDSMRHMGSNSAKLHYVYYRKRFRTRKEALDRKPEQDGNCKNTVTSVCSISSFANSTSTKLIKLNMPILGLMTLTMIFGLPVQYFKKLVCGIGICWPYYAISILQNSELISAWPIVHMEIVFIDKNSGLKLLFFEGCLRRAVSLFCLVMSTFDHCDMSTCTKEEVILTSMGFEISDSCFRQRRLLIVFNNFYSIENSKWEHLEDQIKRHCTKGEVALADCMCSDVMDIAGAQCQKLFKGFVGTSFSDMVCCNTIANELCNSNSNSTLHYVVGEHIPPHLFSLSFLSLLFSPTLHLKLIEKTASLCRGKSTSVSLQECPDIADNLISNDIQTEDFPDHVLDITTQSRTSLGEGEAAVIFQETKADALLPSTDFYSSGDVGNIMKSETIMQYEASFLTRSSQGADELYSFCHEHSSSADKSFYANGESSCNAASSHLQVVDQIEEHSNDKRELTVSHATNMVMGINGQSFHGPTARRSIWRRSRNTSVSQKINHHPKLLTDDILSNGSSRGHKKPRSQVSSSVFSSNYELDSKSQNSYPKSHHNKKIKSCQEYKFADGLFSRQSYMETLSCDANILVSDGTKGWRECGAQVIIHSDQKNWMICVKLSGSTKYVYMVNQSLQPGTTNRYTHAMMWRGGKDWALEFTDRSQWSLFKQMHEECYNHNIRAASIKNIPIPGVQLLSDFDRTIGIPFIRSLSKYHQQVGCEIDFALDPSHVLYDMDSDDEVWVSRLQDSSDPKGSEIPKITEEMFERVMDMLEKLAYSQQRHEFTNDEIDEFLADLGPSSIVKAIHGHWRLKRQKKGLPLIRQFQPPLWELYQKMLKEWESSTSKMPSQLEGVQDKACFNQKPPMFAFCLRPRGLEIPKKGSKHKSHKKHTLSGHNNTLREKEYFSSVGRKSDGTSVGNEKALLDDSSDESSESTDELQSLSSFSTRNTSSTESLSFSEGSDRYPDPKPFRSRPIKVGKLHSPTDFHVTPFSFNQRTKRSGVNKGNSEYLTRPSTKQKLPGFRRHQADINEFTLRDASSAAQHALNMAKLKREKANWLLHKADLAVHRATVALMTAEAIKASEKDIIGDG